MKKITNSIWNSQEEEFAEKRLKLLESVSSEDVANSPFVFTTRQEITKALVRIDLFKKILDVQGSVVECGVYKGNSLFLYAHLSSILEPFNFNRKIIGFDTFEGFRSLDKEHDDKNLSESDFSETDYDLLTQFAEIESQNRAVSHIKKISLVKGDATETIPDFVSKNSHLIIALLYIDFDIYAPTKTALEYLLPLVPKGGIVAFDELNYDKWFGETVALKETLEIGSVRLKKFYYSPFESYFEVE